MENFMEPFTELDGAISALLEIIMARANNGNATEGEQYLILRAADACDRLAEEM